MLYFNVKLVRGNGMGQQSFRKFRDVLTDGFVEKSTEIFFSKSCCGELMFSHHSSKHRYNNDT